MKGWQLSYNAPEFFIVLYSINIFYKPRHLTGLALRWADSQSALAIAKYRLTISIEECSKIHLREKKTCSDVMYNGGE